MKELVLTLIGPDRTGIVARMASIAARHDGNWLDSRMMELGGVFSGLLRVEIPEDKVPEFEEALRSELEPDGLHFTLRAAKEALSAGAEAGGVEAQMELSGQDHPGIVEAIFGVFRCEGVNVRELSTRRPAAPWSGTPVFGASARLELPGGLSVEALEGKLEELAADLLVEVELRG